MKQIPLSGEKGKGYFALVDDEDFPVLSRVAWQIMNGYAFNVRCQNMHSLIMGYPYVNHLHHIDHIDSNRLNNQKANLRVVTVQQNAYHRLKAKWKTPPSSKFKGVCHYYTTANGAKRWMATIAKTENGIQKQRKMCSFTNERDAARAYDKMALEWYGEYAILNFPKQAITP